MAKTQFNTPTVQYLIEARLMGTGVVVDRFTIEQVASGRSSRFGNHHNYNTVQEHLYELSWETRLDYLIVQVGDVADRSKWLNGGPLDPED